MNAPGIVEGEVSWMAPSSLSPAPEERRQGPRVAMHAVIDCGTDSNFFTGFSADVSEGGVFIATLESPAVGTEVDLSFTLPSGEEIFARGVVRWTREVNDATPEVFPGVGVQFTQLDVDGADAIRAFVARRDPFFFPD